MIDKIRIRLVKISLEQSLYPPHLHKTYKACILYVEFPWYLVAADRHLRPQLHLPPTKCPRIVGIYSHLPQMLSKHTKKDKKSDANITKTNIAMYDENILLNAGLYYWTLIYNAFCSREVWYCGSYYSNANTNLIRIDTFWPIVRQPYRWVITL